MAQDMIIRDIRPEDVDAVVEIALAAWEPIYAYRRRLMGDGIFSALTPDWRAHKAREVRWGCQPRQDAGVFVAEEEGRVIAFITFHIDDASHTGEIGNNAVRPDCQGRGIAGRMYAYVLDKMRERGMRYAKVTTGGDPAHAPARRAYEKAGFQIQIPSVTFYREL